MQFSFGGSCRSIACAVALVSVLPWHTADADELDDFAQCVADSGAVLYGAHWCKFTVEQVAEFGASAGYLPYSECYIPDTKTKYAKCQRIRSFPTWLLPDGEFHSGLMSLAELAEATDCDLPRR